MDYQSIGHSFKRLDLQGLLFCRRKEGVYSLLIILSLGTTTIQQVSG